MDSQEVLNEIQYGDKRLLLTDGIYIRVALVLDKESSIILRQHLKEFLEVYERIYSNSLPNWRGKLDISRNSGQIIDDVFYTSIILSHIIKYDVQKFKSLYSPHSKDILRIAHPIIKKSDRKVFFLLQDF
ncbi:MAG: hypothetical protein ACFFAN_02490 [Promethearchaeota archaeon]